MTRKVVAIVAFVMFTSLCVAGCTSSTNNTSAGQHDAFLEKYLTAYQTEVKGSTTSHAWKVTWVNSTAATVHFTFGNSAGNSTASTNVSIVRFQSVPEATSYVNGLSKTGYALVTTVYDLNDPYQHVTGHAPTTYREYEKTTGGSLGNTTIYRIIQMDDLVENYTITSVSTA